MCVYFSCIVVSPLLAKRFGQGSVYFTEGSDHETILNRLGINDYHHEGRSFVRIECEDGDINEYREDEVSTLPRWYSKPRYFDKVGNVLDEVKKIRAQYLAITQMYYKQRDQIPYSRERKRNKLTDGYLDAVRALFVEANIKGYVKREQTT